MTLQLNSLLSLLNQETIFQAMKKEPLISPEGRLPYNPKLSDRAKQMRQNMTPAEKRSWFDVLKSEKLKRYKFIKQRVIDNYIVDFYCSELKLVIEIDGEIHNEQIEYDKIRTELLELCGLKILRFENEEVMNDTDGCIDKLIKFIETQNKSPSQGEMSDF